MDLQGQRCILELGHSDQHPCPGSSSPLAVGLIGEIHERTPSAVVPPAPTPPSGVGFPRHRHRAKLSSFKQHRSQPENLSTSSRPTSSAPSISRCQPTLHEEKSSIDEENRRRLASMSTAQIQHEREELMSSISPSLLEQFLRRANIDDDDSPERESRQSSNNLPLESKGSVSPRPKPSPSPPQTYPQANDDLPPRDLPGDLHPASEPPRSSTFHFPTPPHQNPVPNLDPTSPNFLSDLQTHYFPSIPHDPIALQWLKPSSSGPDDPESSISAYHPSSSVENVSPSAIRFALTGTMLSPSTSLSLPTTLGLHHHGHDPHAAGYTIPELAILGRSSFPAQRCIAWQILGRILFRLGKGEFGERGGTLVEGLWFVIEKEKVVAAMLAEADGAGLLSPGQMQTQQEKGDRLDSVGGAPGRFRRHASAAAWAVDGVWLWQIGGGGDRGLLKEGVVRSQ